MKTEEIPFNNNNFKGGLNTNGNPMMISNEESSDLQNIDFDKFGRLKKRNGYIHLNSTAIT